MDRDAGGSDGVGGERGACAVVEVWHAGCSEQGDAGGAGALVMSELVTDAVEAVASERGGPAARQIVGTRVVSSVVMP